MINVRSFLRPGPAQCRRSRSEDPGTSMPGLRTLTPTSILVWRLPDGSNGLSQALRPPASPLLNMEITVRDPVLCRVRRSLLSSLTRMSFNSNLPSSSLPHPGLISRTSRGRPLCRERLPLFRALPCQVLLLQGPSSLQPSFPPLY